MPLLSESNLPSEAPSRLRILSNKSMVAKVAILAAIAAVAVTVIRRTAVAVIDYEWFKSVNAGSTWTTLTSARFGLGLFGSMWVFVCVGGSLLIASRNGGPTDNNLYTAQFNKHVKGRQKLVALAVIGYSVYSYGISFRYSWQQWLLFWNGSTTGVTEPIFGRDVSSYLFDLPFITRLITVLWNGITVSLCISTVWYLINGGIRVKGIIPRSITSPAKRHLLFLCAATLALAAARLAYVERLRLSVTPAGGFSGASYVDAKYRSPLYLITAIAMLCAAAALAYTGAVGRIRVATKRALAILVIPALITATVPLAVQTLVVNPAKAGHEATYIEAHKAATYDAFGLNNARANSFEMAANGDSLDPTSTGLNRSPLVDPVRAQSTFQALRGKLNLSVGPVAIDRYVTDDNTSIEHAVALAPQMPDRKHLSDPWEEAHLVFLSGNGVLAASADSFDPTGRPKFIDMNSPDTPSSLRIEHPDLFFGPGLDGWYGIVNTTKSQDQSERRVDVPLDNVFHRAAAAIAFQDPALLLSSYLTPKSGLITQRSIAERLAKIAPYLTQVGDPVPVVADGRIVWVADLITTATSYPGALFLQITQSDGSKVSTNYARASVKAVIDATTGDVRLYRMDRKIGSPDPVLDVYARTFPSVFHDASEMPRTIQDHLIYPDEIFAAQVQLLGRYRVNDSSTILHRSAEWTISPDIGATIKDDGSGRIASVVGFNQVGTDRGFVRQLALVPGQIGAQRPETAGIATVGQGVSNYGSIVITEIASAGNSASKSKALTPDSPTALQRTIDSDTRISWQLTQLNQSGSSVSFGPLVLTLADGDLVAVRPVYVSGNGSGSFSRLLAVAVIRNGTAVLAPTVELGLEAIEDPNLAKQLSNALLPTGADQSGSSADSTSAGAGANGKNADAP